MGLLMSIFRSRKPKKEKLHELDETIRHLERDIETKQSLCQRAMSLCIKVAIVLCIIIAVSVHYFKRFQGQGILVTIMYMSPMTLVPVVLLLLRTAISKYLLWRKRKLDNLKQDKKKLLEDMMESESYKVVKEILEKYGEEDAKTMPVSTKKAVAVISPANQAVTPVNSNNRCLTPVLKADRLPSLLPPKDRNIVEKVLDYMLRNGPEHRMALICKACHSHNGMVLEEEFDYINYRCAYCGFMHLARKKRPSAPPLHMKLLEKENNSVSNIDVSNNEISPKRILADEHTETKTEENKKNE